MLFYTPGARAWIWLVALFCAACASPVRHESTPVVAAAHSGVPRVAEVEQKTDPYASTYTVPAAPVTAIVNATILTAAGPRIEHGTVLFAEGRIRAVGSGVELPPGARVIDGAGLWVTPGLIDFHSHAGLMFDGMRIEHANELSDPNSAQIRIEDSIWPQSPVFQRLLMGGVTTLHVLPGSGDLFAGRTVVLKNVPSADVAGMKFPDAPYGLKMACGENPIMAFGGKGRAPMTRAGEFAGYRAGFLAASNYAKHWDSYRAQLAKGVKADPPARDLMLETLAGVLRGEIKLHIHCYTAAEMSSLIAVSHEFDFHIAAFHHATEAFKIAPKLAQEHIAVATWAGDWSEYKLEAYDAIMENAAFVQQAGGTAIIHSDNENIAQHLNIEAARAMFAGRRAGFQIAEEDAIRWLTSNPATVLGLADRIGSLQPGKAADVVLWSTNPFSTYAVAEKVFIDGALRFDRANPDPVPRSDFEVGQPRIGGRP